MKNGVGRKKLSISKELVEQLARIHCTLEEIGSIVKCSPDTLRRRFSKIIKNAEREGKMSLKRAMWKKALTEENTTMQIWLSKNILGYTDKVETEQVGQTTFKLAYTKEDVKKFIQDVKGGNNHERIETKKDASNEETREEGQKIVQ
jgi:hypothetical protein